MWAHYAEEMLNTLDAGDIEEAMNAAAAVGDDKLQMKYQGRLFLMLLHMVLQRNVKNGSARDGRLVILIREIPLKRISKGHSHNYFYTLII